MPKLMKRDYKILRVLSLGVATFTMIRQLLNEVSGCGITESALLRRLSILRRSGYLITRKEPFRKKHGNLTIYALTPIAANELAASGYPIEFIRTGLPGQCFCATRTPCD